jgi:hypothetical protein
MPKSSHGKRKQARHRFQMKIAFPTKGPLDADERSQIIALLSRLLLQVASAIREGEVPRDAS